MRVHISASGKPARCEAKDGACPLGENTIHGDFDSLGDANGWAEDYLAKQAGGAFSGGLSKGPKLTAAQKNRAAIYESFQKSWKEFELEGVEFAVYYQAQEVPFVHSDELSSEFEKKAMSLLKENYDKNLNDYLDDLSEGELEDPDAVEEFRSDGDGWPMGESIHELLRDEKEVNPATGEEEITALGINGLHSIDPKDTSADVGERARKLQALPLRPIARDYLLTKSYGDSHDAEPSNILKIIADENEKVQLLLSAFPVDGSQQQDGGRFSVDGVEFSYSTKRDKVWISVVGEENSEFSFEESRDGYGLKEKLELVVKNAKGISNYAQSGRPTSKFTETLERFGGNL